MTATDKKCVACQTPTDNIYLNGVTLCHDCVMRMANPTRQDLVPLEEKDKNDLIVRLITGKFGLRPTQATDVADYIVSRFGVPGARAVPSVDTLKLLGYVSHDDKCLCGQFKAGRSTENGGYETLYGYGENEKWYKRGEDPICSCGLNEIIERLKISICKTGEKGGKDE